MTGYKPGVCNIGKNEIRKRYAMAAIGFLISAAIVCAVVAYRLPLWTLLLLFLPLLFAFEGFYQGYLRFCAGFAAAGVYDFAGSGGSRGKVSDKEAHMRDMRKAIMIHAYAIFSSIALTIIIYLAVLVL